MISTPSKPQAKYLSPEELVIQIYKDSEIMFRKAEEDLLELMKKKYKKKFETYTLECLNALEIEISELPNSNAKNWLNAHLMYEQNQRLNSL